jgi:glyceraldehyde 3-phosphate dehydrogenase
MPELIGKVEGSAINVPIPNGSLLDLNTGLKTKVKVEEINKVMDKAAKGLPHIIQVVDDPIVSTDVIDNSHSLIFDKKATMLSPGRMVKNLIWYHGAYAMAARIKELILAYDKADRKGGAK